MDSCLQHNIVTCASRNDMGAKKEAESEVGICDILRRSKEKATHDLLTLCFSEFL